MSILRHTFFTTSWFHSRSRPMRSGALWIPLLLMVLSQGLAEPSAGRADVLDGYQKLPVLTYTVGDGLPSSHILDLDQDP